MVRFSQLLLLFFLDVGRIDIRLGNFEACHGRTAGLEPSWAVIFLSVVRRRRKAWAVRRSEWRVADLLGSILASHYHLFQFADILFDCWDQRVALVIELAWESVSEVVFDGLREEKDTSLFFRPHLVRSSMSPLILCFNTFDFFISSIQVAI